MAINSELFKAILAMDSYNRGYDAGIEFGQNSDAIGIKIGNATVAKNSGVLVGSDGTTRLDIPAGFYAIAYTLASGQKVVSYRGTDDNPLDIATGWTVGAALLGLPYTQSQLAVDFFKAVAGSTDPYLAHISTTGHSLGGGLAGLVAALYRQPADIFDNMPFELAVTTLAPLLLISGAPAASFSGISA